jgi:hypothetical protein
MDNIIKLDLVNTPREKAIDLVMEYYGVDRCEASFIVALERGEVEGDVIIVDDFKEEEQEDPNKK